MDSGGKAHEASSSSYRFVEVANLLSDLLTEETEQVQVEGMFVYDHDGNLVIL